jgi:putative redox protein
MKATLNWNGGMNFTGIANSGYAIQMDTDVNLGGNNNGVRPMEMIALGLAGCTGMDVISILQKKRQKITKFEVSIDAARSPDYPKVFTNAIITFIVTGNDVDESAMLRAMELSATKYCPVHAMLEQAFPIYLRYEIYEDEGNGNRRLIHQGAWHEMLME